MSLWSSRSWYTIWNGVAWLNARKLSSDQAEDWYVTQLEAMGGGQPLSNIVMFRWTGSAWKRA